MSEAARAIQRLRSMVGASDSEVLDLGKILPRYFPVAWCVVPSLSVDSIRSWFAGRRLALPSSLEDCTNRRLRGGLMAQRGKAVLFIDGEDEPAEQRYSLAHEGGHYLIDHRFPRDELLEQFGDSILDVLNGLRQPALTERVDAVLNRSTLTTMTHLLERESGVARMMAEAESQADALAIEALAPTAAVLRFLPALKDHPGEAVRVRQVLQSEFAVPSDIAEFYAPRICVTCGRPIDFRARFGLELA